MGTMEWIMGQEIDTNLLTTASHVAQAIYTTRQHYAHETSLDPVR